MHEGRQVGHPLCPNSCRSPTAIWDGQRPTAASKVCSCRKMGGLGDVVGVPQPGRRAMSRQWPLGVPARHVRRLSTPSPLHLHHRDAGQRQALGATHPQAVTAHPSVHPGSTGPLHDNAPHAALRQTPLGTGPCPPTARNSAPSVTPARCNHVRTRPTVGLPRNCAAPWPAGFILLRRISTVWSCRFASATSSAASRRPQRSPAPAASSVARPAAS